MVVFVVQRRIDYKSCWSLEEIFSKRDDALKFSYDKNKDTGDYYQVVEWWVV